MKLIQKVWDKNKVFLHSTIRYKGKEIHHIFNRIGVCKCCLLLLYPATFGHQNDWKWVNDLRERFKHIKEAVLENYVRNLGCKDKIDIDCWNCAMPKTGAKIEVSANYDTRGTDIDRY